MSVHSLNVNRTAHYHQIGTPGKHINRLIIACHGYGQAVDKFIQKFDQLDDGKTLIVAPEGLSKFYFGGMNGEVGASWMTKEHREDEITDYLNYLEQLQALLTPQLSDDLKVTLYGFSQGGTTITRYAILRQPSYHRLIIWASDFAHDIDFKAANQHLKTKQIYWVIGNQDQFINESVKEKYLAFAKEQEIPYQLVEFEGKHQIKREVLAKLMMKD